jgi:hypothetical protein
MPVYDLLQGWIHEDSKTIFTGRKEKVEAALKDVDNEQFKIISSTAQSRLGFALRDHAREEYKENGNPYTVYTISTLVTLNNVIRSYGRKEGIFKPKSLISDTELQIWIEKYSG